MVPTPASTVVDHAERDRRALATPLPTSASAIPPKAAKTRMMLNQSLKASKASQAAAGEPPPTSTAEPGEQEHREDQGEAGDSGDLLTWRWTFDHALSSWGRRLV